MALATAVLGVSFLATTGTASASDPRHHYDDRDDCWSKDYNRCKDDHDDRDHKDRDKYDVCYKCHDDRDYDKKKHDYYDNRDNVRVRIVYALIFATPVPYGYVDFTPYSQGTALLVQHTAWVIGIDTYTVFYQLSLGRTLVDIATSYGIGQAALIEGLVGFNRDLQPFVLTIITRGWLLTSNTYIPM